MSTLGHHLASVNLYCHESDCNDSSLLTTQRICIFGRNVLLLKSKQREKEGLLGVCLVSRAALLPSGGQMFIMLRSAIIS